MLHPLIFQFTRITRRPHQKRGAAPFTAWRTPTTKFFFVALLVFSNLSALCPNSKYCGSNLVVLVSAEKIRPESNVTKKDRKDSRELGGLRGIDVMNDALRQQQEKQKSTFAAIVYKAGKKGMGGGISGAAAGVIQVLSLMWIRTIINYQYRYGTSFIQAVKTLLNQGGVRRFYRGVGFALIQNPLSKFGSTAANDGVQVIVASLDATKNWGPGRTTVISSICVGIWRMMLMPIDTCKTVLQVDSQDGFRDLIRKVRAGKVGVLYEGALANAVQSVFSYYPWFYTYNVLSGSEWWKNLIKSPLVRNGAIGFLASVVSDTLTNFIRVIKTTKQSIATKHAVGYGDAISMILAADGMKGLFGRGLKTRLLANAMQSVVFTIVWRGIADRLATNNEEEKTV